MASTVYEQNDMWHVSSTNERRLIDFPGFLSQVHSLCINLDLIIFSFIWVNGKVIEMLPCITYFNFNCERGKQTFLFRFAMKLISIIWTPLLVSQFINIKLQFVDSDLILIPIFYNFNQNYDLDLKLTMKNGFPVKLIQLDLECQNWYDFIVHRKIQTEHFSDHFWGLNQFINIRQWWTRFLK